MTAMGDGTAQTKPAGAGQDCLRCQLRSACWQPQATEDQQVLRLLVCRFKREISPNITMALLLQMLRPKLQTMTRRILSQTAAVAHATRVTSREVRAELEAAVFFGLRNYTVGEPVGPLQWLFGRSGAVQIAALRFLRDTRRHGGLPHPARRCPSPERAAVFVAAAAEAMPTFASDAVVEPNGSESEDSDAAVDKIELALRIVDDGVTLPLDEYRVLRFCLTWADERRARPVDGLLVHLARLRGVDRRRIESTYASAVRRLRDAVAIRLNGSSSPADRRRAIRLTTPHRWQDLALSPVETVALLQDLRQHPPPASVRDLAWKHGITQKTIQRIRRRWADIPLAQVATVLGAPCPSTEEA